jgi:uncharacterized protein (TIGR03437 family)
VATGWVTFYDGVSIVGSAPITAGRATRTIVLRSGRRALRARYRGDGTYLGSLSEVSVQSIVAMPQKGLAAEAPLANVRTPGPVVVCDFNADGKADVATIATMDRAVLVLFGNRDGTVRQSGYYPVGALPMGLVCGHLNDDGYPDLAVANRDSGDVSVLINTGDGTFKEAVAYPSGSAPVSVVVADFNGDGRADLASSNMDGNTVSVFLGTGSGAFQRAIVSPAGVSPLLIAAGDFNKDGFADLVIPNRETDTASVLIGKGDGTFLSPVSHSVGSKPSAVAVADFNIDGIDDFAVVTFGSGKVSILVGNGDGTFRNVSSIGAGQYPSSLAIGEFNGDDKPDISVCNAGGRSVSVLLGNGDGAFRPAGMIAVGIEPVPAGVGDLNGDGRDDVVVPSHGSNTLSVLLGVAAHVDLAISKSHAGAFAAGQRGARYSLVVANVGQDSTVGEVAVRDTLPTGLTATALDGPGWNCRLPDLECLRTDPLAAGTQYPPITLTVDISPAVATEITNVATVTARGESNLANNRASDSAIVTPASAPIILTETLEPGALAQPYSVALAAGGGMAPYRWRVSSGALPIGLTLSESGTLSGSPQSAGSFAFVITIVDAAGASAVRQFTLLIAGPFIADGGVVNAASFAKEPDGRGSAVAPGSLVSVYGSFPGATEGSVQLTFDGIPAPILGILLNGTGSHGFINAQVPYELLKEDALSSTVNVAISINGLTSAPVSVPVVAVAPGIFTIPPDGQHSAVLVYVDSSDGLAKVAAPETTSVAFGIPARPIERGQSGFFYATGLGALTPAVPNGSGGPNHPETLSHARLKPRVFVGEVEAEVLFAGQAPGFIGVNQINILIPPNAPVGDAIPIRIVGAHATKAYGAATIAIQ